MRGGEEAASTPASLFVCRCGREDSNLHLRGDRDLNPARLPVPPRPHIRLTFSFLNPTHEAPTAVQAAFRYVLPEPSVEASPRSALRLGAASPDAAAPRRGQ